MNKNVFLLIFLVFVSSICLAQKSKDKQKRYANNELPIPVFSDPELELKIVETMNQHAKANGWKETFSKAIIATEWKTVRNELSGVITKRIIKANVCASWPDGHCTYQLFTMGNDFNGSDYSDKLYRIAHCCQMTIWCDKLNTD